MELRTPGQPVHADSARQEIEAQVPLRTRRTADMSMIRDDEATVASAGRDLTPASRRNYSDLDDWPTTTRETLALAWSVAYVRASEWDEAFSDASESDSESSIAELLDMPLLASYLEAGLAAFDYSCEGVGQND